MLLYRIYVSESFCRISTQAVLCDKKRGRLSQTFPLFGAPAEIRTPDTLIKSQVLYRLSYRGAFAYLYILAHFFRFVKMFFMFLSIYF